MNELTNELLFYWLPLSFLLIQWLFLLAVIALAGYVLLWRRRIDQLEQASEHMALQEATEPAPALITGAPAHLLWGETQLGRG